MTELDTSNAEANGRVDEVARWTFDEGAGATASDSTGNGHTLTAVGDVGWTSGGRAGGAVALDGATQWLATETPVLRTDESFSVAAWVCLDRDALGPEIKFPPDVYAYTAVSQSGPGHSPFYLGVRLVDEKVRWCFTVSPEDGLSVEWQHAASTAPVDRSMLDTWVLLVAAFDVEAGTTHLYVPGSREHATVPLPDGWPHWHGYDGLQVGQGRFESKPADMWPGAIGRVQLFSGVLTAEDVDSLYSDDAPAGA